MGKEKTTRSPGETVKWEMFRKDVEVAEPVPGVHEALGSVPALKKTKERKEAY